MNKQFGTKQAIRVEICGGVAAGKTALAKSFRVHHPSTLQFVFEEYRTLPFWRRQGCLHSLEFERNISFIISHAASILANVDDSIFCDFAMFENLAYADLCEKADLELISLVYNRMNKHIPLPALIINLLSSPATRLCRIKARGRREEAELSSDYLERLGASIQRRLIILKDEYKVPIFTVDTDTINYVDNPSNAQCLCNKLYTEIQMVIRTGGP